MWAGTNAYTPLALRVRWLHISAPGAQVQCGKLTAQTITLPDHSAVYNVECRHPQGGIGQMPTPADRGKEGGRKTDHILRTSFMDDPYRTLT